MQSEGPNLALNLELPLAFSEALATVTEELKREGFGVLTEIDVQQTLKDKLGEDFRRYHILGACNPPLAHRALSSTLQVGVLLPCNVILYETDDGKTHVSILDPQAMLSFSELAEVELVASEAREKLEKVRDRLAG